MAEVKLYNYVLPIIVDDEEEESVKETVTLDSYVNPITLKEEEIAVSDSESVKLGSYTNSVTTDTQVVTNANVETIRLNTDINEFTSSINKAKKKSASVKSDVLSIVLDTQISLEEIKFKKTNLTSNVDAIGLDTSTNKFKTPVFYEAYAYHIENLSNLYHIEKTPSGGM